MDRLYYSGKKGYHTIKYEVAITSTSPYHIIYVGGGVPGGLMNDLQLARHGYLNTVNADELVLADMGYIGDPCFVTPIKRGGGRELSADEQSWNQTIASLRIPVEHIMGHIKRFGCMRSPWRHDWDKHPTVFRVICELLEVEILVREHHFSLAHDEQRN